MAGDAAEVPEYVGNRKRSERFELSDHIKYKGKVYTEVFVRRLNAKQVADWAAAARAGDKDADLGQIVDDEGNPVPQVVMDMVDDDDDLKIQRLAESFLPQRLLESLASEPETQT